MWSLHLVLSVFNLQQQQRTITGKVTDEQGLPLPGVNIMVKGTSIGTITDMDGNYSLSVPASAVTLVFLFVGMETQEVAIGNQSTINGNYLAI